MTNTTIYEFRIIRSKPEFTLEFYQHFLETKKVYEKFGAKTIGTWVAEGGEVGTYYVLREWTSMSARVAAREKMWNDHEFQKVYKETFHMIRMIQSFLCHTALNMPVTTPNPKSHVVVHKLRPKTFSLFAARKYRELEKQLNEMQGLDNIRPIATLYPLVYNEFRMITIWEVPADKLDATYERLIECRRDPTNWPTISEFQETFEDASRVLAAPVDVTKAPRLHSH